MADKQKSRGMAELHADEKVFSKDKVTSLRDFSVGIDVSEAITGLKAVQREAKKATQALNEFTKYLNENEEQVQVILSAFSTADLQRQLSAREGIRTIAIPNTTKATISVEDTDTEANKVVEGPAIITINID